MMKISDTQRVIKYITQLYHKPQESENLDKDLILKRLQRIFKKIEITLKISLNLVEDSFGNLFLRKSMQHPNPQTQKLLLHGHYDSYNPDSLIYLPHSHVSIDLTKTHDAIILHGTPHFDDSIIGLGIICAILESDYVNTQNCNLEVLITRKENEKFSGVNFLNPNLFPIESRYLLNFDGVDLASITHATGGCAEFVLSKKMTHMEQQASDLLRIRLKVDHLLGGDMGSEIHYLRGNAITIIARILAALIASFRIYLIQWKGGHFYRFIPRQSEVEIALHQSEWNSIQSELKKQRTDLIKKYRRFTDYGDNLEPDLKITWNTVLSKKSHDLHLSDTTPPSKICSIEDSKTIIGLSTLIPHGLLGPINSDPEENKICNNFAKIRLESQQFSLHCRVRWTDEVEYQYFRNKLESLANLSRSTIIKNYFIPMWHPSEIRAFSKFVQNQYEHIVYQPVRIMKSFWTMELGVLEKKYPDLECVAVGPTEIGVYPHPYQVKISHIQALYRLLKKIIENLQSLS